MFATNGTHRLADVAMREAAWFADRLDMVTDSVPAEKLLVGMGQYGYH